jgi:GNAT superfamily N-acetyltransferase
VRLARVDDWPAIANCFAQAGVAAWGSFLPREFIRALSAPERWQSAVYKGSPLNPVLVVESEAQVIGFSILRPSEDEDALPLTGELDAFYTHPHFWGQGAGLTLMHETISKAKELDFKRLTLWTEERNERPRRFYHLNGWREDQGIRKRELHGAELTEVRYLKEL